MLVEDLEESGGGMVAGVINERLEAPMDGSKHIDIVSALGGESNIVSNRIGVVGEYPMSPPARSTRTSRCSTSHMAVAVQARHLPPTLAP